MVPLSVCYFSTYVHSPTSKIDKVPQEVKCHIRAQVLIRQSTFFNLGVGVTEKSTPKSIIRVVISLDFREGYLSLAEGPKYL